MELVANGKAPDSTLFSLRPSPHPKAVAPPPIKKGVLKNEKANKKFGGYRRMSLFIIIGLGVVFLGVLVYIVIS